MNGISFPYRFKSNRFCNKPRAEFVPSKTGRTFTLFTRLPLEIQRMIWQEAQPQRVLELVFDDETGYSGIEDPMLTPGVISRVCQEARQETIRTFSIIPKCLPLVPIQPQWTSLSSDSKTLSDTDDSFDPTPRRLKSRIAWFESGRDIVYWNGNSPATRKWHMLEEDALVIEQLRGPIEKCAIGHVMLSADVFSNGFWNIKRTISLFPNLKMISVLAGGMSLYEDSHARRQRPICTLVDLSSKSQKDRVSRAIVKFKLPHDASDQWRRIRQHSEETNTSGAIKHRAPGQRCTNLWELSTVEYNDLCRSKVEWEGDLESFKQGYLTYKWQNVQKTRGRSFKTEAVICNRATYELEHTEHVENIPKKPVKDFFAWKRKILDSLPRFRQVFVLRMHTYKNEACGLEEVTF